MTDARSVGIEEFLSTGRGLPNDRAAGRGLPGDQVAVGPICVAPVGHGELSSLRYRLPAAGYVMRELRGTKMSTVSHVFDEFAAAFQFPYYFGENKDAFDECMRDLDEFVGSAAGYVVVIRDADRLLSAEPDQRAWFYAAMRFYASQWAERTPAVAFRVVLQGVPARIRQSVSGGDLPTLQFDA